MNSRFIVDPSQSPGEAFIFITSRKRWVWRGLTAAGLTLICLIVSRFMESLSGVALGGVTIFGVVGIVEVFYILRPPRLHIDTLGLTTVTLPRLRKRQILWSQIEEICILQRRLITGQEVVLLVAWLAPGTQALKKGAYLPEWRPIWNKEIGALQICNLRDFSTPASEIGDAVARFAGERWNESGKPR